jgi:hypothetical protein
MTGRRPDHKPPASHSSARCHTAKRQTAELAAMFHAYVEALHPLVSDMVRSGLSHEATAAALNRRGIPCWGRDRWTTALVRTVLRQRP